MSIEKRRFIRFSLDVPAFRYTDKGEEMEIMIRQISVGGCLVELDDTIFTGDEFRLEIPLPNKNRLPVLSKAIYRFNGHEVGVKFHDITQFEQELIASIISENLESEGLPVLVDPFTQPPRFVQEMKPKGSEIENQRLKKEEKVDEVVATEA